MGELTVVRNKLITPRTNKGMGWRGVLPDHRDHIADTSGIKVLTEVDPRADMPSIYDQLQLGSCTANADKRVFEYDRLIRGLDLADVSRLAIYWLERWLEGSSAKEDTGAYGRDGFKALQKIGAPTEGEWSYTDDTSNPHFYEDPRQELPATDFIKLDGTYKVVPQALEQFQAALSNKQMISVGATLYESFESPEVAKTGIVPTPGKDEEVIGGHQFVVIGYLKDEPHYGLCANSWGSRKTDGTEWGIDAEGCFLMPWTYLLNPRLVSDCRTIPHAA
jgi:C1A family cysteine protease